MANPLKRVCLQATRHRTAPIQQVSRWPSVRPISSTSAQQATEISSDTSGSNEPSDDAYLDKLAKRPGVKYSTTEGDEDLHKLNIKDMSSMAHRELEQHRELREVMRLAAWEMPLLSQLSKAFEPPTQEQVLLWRYTTYLGEAHPASRKVVVEFQPERLTDLNAQQRHKLLKLAGLRYNPSTKTIKMSCESFETQAQNKRYLGDTIAKLIAESTDPDADAFADVPLDTRHHKPRQVHKFPPSWILTPERKAELEEKRRVKMLEDSKRVEDDRLVSGVKAIEDARQLPVKEVEEPVMIEARQPLARGKMGKKGMGQNRGGTEIAFTY